MSPRETFQKEVFHRDNNRCVCCEKPATAAHHLMERRLWDDGGYHLDNGVSLCDEDHLLAEKTLISPQELREKAGIKTVILPPHLDPDKVYDKWGNPHLNKDTRARGELFYEPSVQKILNEAGVLSCFTDRVKYPRTMHLPWSPGLQNDDRRIESLQGLAGQEVVVTAKLDGENATMSRNYIHARSLDSKDHPSRNWVKSLWGQIKHEIPEDFLICGENLYAEHSIHYDNLPSYFAVFNMWDRGRRLSWDEMTGYCELLGLEHVPVLWRGTWDEEKTKELCQNLNPESHEGVVVQVTREIRAGEWRMTSAKFVRKGHVQTTEFWMNKPVVPNGMAKDPKKASFEGRKPKEQTMAGPTI
jgi:hypothetical protein